MAPNAPSLSAEIDGKVKLHEPWLTQLRDAFESLIRDICVFRRLRADDSLKHGRRSSKQDISSQPQIIYVATLFSDPCPVLAVDGRAEVGKKW